MKNALVIGFIIFAGVLAWWWSSPSAVKQADGQILVEVIVPELSPEAMDGEDIFNANCAVCHGPNAAGKNGLGPPLVHIIYETGHHGDQAFHLAARNGVKAHHWPFGNMPPVPGVKDSEVDKIVYYVRELQRANGIF